jgi:hypothetical protein
LPAHVDPDARVGQIDDDAAFIAAAASKIDVVKRVPAITGALFGKMLRDGRASGAGGPASAPPSVINTARPSTCVS